MSEVQQIIEKAHALIANFEYGTAQQLLTDAVKRFPDDVDMNAEVGLIYCFGQKEFEAVPHLPKSVGSDRHELLAATLRDYFYCRKEMAKKLKVSDDKADGPCKIVEKFAKGKPEGIGVKLSACLIVKNEEKHLEKCLTSIQPIVDEIVVVDTGSTDRTVEIAEKFGAKIGHFEWCDDFSAARNESLKLATGDWALWIDADEELDPESFTQIREGLMRPQFAGYYFQIINFMEAEKEANTYLHTAIRLFRIVPGVWFTGRIHEQIIGGFKDLGMVPATLTKGVLKHYGYQHESMVEKDKINRTITMLRREVEECPQEPFHWFNLANAYSVASMPAPAEEAARKCVDLIDKDAPYGPAVFQILCSSLTALKRPNEALLFNNRAVEKGYDTILNEFERSHAYFELGRLDEALVSIDRTMAMDWPISLTGDFGIKKYKSHVLKCQILTGLGRYDEAAEAVEFSLSVHPEFPMALFAKAKLCEKTARLDEAYDLYLRCCDAPGMEPCRMLAGKAALAGGLYMEAMLVFQQAWYENQSDYQAWYGWITACNEMGDQEGYIMACAQVGEDQISDAGVLVNWGRWLEGRGDTDAALQKFGVAITRDPENANAYFNCGDLLYKLGHFKEAARVYELGLRRQPQNADAWFTLGNCFARMNILQGAVTSYNQALVIAPDHEGAKHNLDTVSEAA
jgi:tetratricopeptide (TPR) repeat protein